MKHFKKLSSVLLVALGMIRTASVPAEDPAFVVNYGRDGLTPTLTTPFGIYTGQGTYVFTSSGQANFSFSGSLEIGPGPDQNEKISFVQPLGFTLMEINCVLTKSGKANCSGKEV